jgi:hypothetical protein
MCTKLCLYIYRRIGASEGTSKLFSSEFLSDVDKNSVKKKKMTAPFIPSIPPDHDFVSTDANNKIVRAVQIYQGDQDKWRIFDDILL